MPHKVFHRHHHHHHHYHYHYYHKEKVSQISECDTVNSSELKKTLNISIEENIESNLKKGIKEDTNRHSDGSCISNYFD